MQGMRYNITESLAEMMRKKFSGCVLNYENSPNTLKTCEINDRRGK